MTTTLMLARTTSGCVALMANKAVVAEAATTDEMDRLVVNAARQLSKAIGVPVVEHTVEVPDELDGKWEWPDLFYLLPPMANNVEPLS
jgi:hypothetical protein